MQQASPPIIRIALAILLLFAPPPPARAYAQPELLLIEPDAHPTLTIRWTTPAGEERAHRATLPYTADPQRIHLGGNIEAFVAVGGTRLTKGAGHPLGVVVRAGFYKHDKNLPFFAPASDAITKDTLVEVTLAGVRFNQPAHADPRSIVQHLKYDLDDLEACGLPGEARDQFNLADPRETLNDRIEPGVDARPGALDGSEDALGSAELTIADDGAATMTVRFRYPALRNLRDPWNSDLPGTFLEPIHFHLEFEAVPEGVEPLDPARPRRAPEPAED